MVLELDMMYHFNCWPEPFHYDHKFDLDLGLEGQAMPRKAKD